LSDAVIGGELPVRSSRSTALTASKRTLDLTLGAVLALVALPLIVVLALGVALELRTWPFFTQQRPGFRGGSFTIVKLRTLPRSTPRYASKLDLEIARMPLPPLCRLLRRSHLDELPQLLLVPLGTMSLVGPRPRQPDEVESVDPVFDRLRSSVRPGCTGLWQVGTAAELLINGAPTFDLFYLRHACLRLDLWLLVRTVPFMLRLARPIDVHEVPRWVRGAGLVRAPTVLPTQPAKPVLQISLTRPGVDAPSTSLSDA
jgi:lipopolysaccharide/colanic/teichoic acid biosynthesis glycosyltransferase